jgi:hypothetical protein
MQNAPPSGVVRSGWRLGGSASSLSFMSLLALHQDRAAQSHSGPNVATMGMHSSTFGSGDGGTDLGATMPPPPPASAVAGAFVSAGLSATPPSYLSSRASAGAFGAGGASASGVGGPSVAQSKSVVVPKIVSILTSLIHFVIPGPATGSSAAEVWSDVADRAIVVFLNAKFDKDPSGSSFWHHDIDALRTSTACLSRLTVAQVCERVQQLLSFNKHLASVLPFVDLSGDHFSTFPGAALSRVRLLTLYCTKDELLKRCLAATQSPDQRPSVTLDRFLAMRRPSRNIFRQLMRQLGGANSVALQAMRSASMQNRPWHVRSFVGEHGLDLGGLFNSSLTEAVEAAVSPTSVIPTPLFIPSPNARCSSGRDQDKVVPNPSATTPLHLAMFRFFGQLLGVTVRLSYPIDLRLPSWFWKAVVGEHATLSDLERVDHAFVEAMKRLERRFGGDCGAAPASVPAPAPAPAAAPAAATADAAANAASGALPARDVPADAAPTAGHGVAGSASGRGELPQLFYAVTLSDGSVKELLPGGAATPVHPHGVSRFVRLAVAARLQVSLHLWSVVSGQWSWLRSSNAVLPSCLVFSCLGLRSRSLRALSTPFLRA